MCSVYHVRSPLKTHRSHNELRFNSKSKDCKALMNAEMEVNGVWFRAGDEFSHATTLSNDGPISHAQITE